MFLWPNKACIEQQIALDLPWDSIQLMLNLAFEFKGEASVRDAIRERTTTKPKFTGRDVDDWVKAGVDQAEMRAAIGKAAHAGEWFKDMTRGEALGGLVAAALPSIPTTPLAKTLTRVREWVYGGS